MSSSNINLKKGDTVVVTVGRDQGKRGKILQLVDDRKKALVENVNLIKRHTRQDAQGGGGIIEKEAPLHISNVMLVCPKCNEPTRIANKLLEDGRKLRACRKCKEVID